MEKIYTTEPTEIEQKVYDILDESCNVVKFS